MNEPTIPLNQNVFHQMSMETTTCYWCGIPAQGTARDEEGLVHLTCGQEGHGEG